MDVYEQAQEFRAALARRDARAAGELLRAYRLASQRIERRVSELTRQIDEARRSGAPVSSSWLFERGRLAQLKLEIQIEINTFSQVASIRVTREQHAAIEQGRSDASMFVGTGDGAPAAIRLGSLNPSAISTIAGFAGDGSHLRNLFASKGADVARAVGDELVSGVATGSSVRAIAGRVRGVLGGELGRALTIARTEVLRAYRASALSTYRAAGIVSYRWVAAKDVRTCLVCLALDGTVYPVTQPMPAHPCCRCTFVPVIGDEATKQVETAEEWFDSLSEGAKKQMLGPAAYEAYKAGKLTLKDFVGFKQSARWGLTAYRRPLTEILSND